MKPSVSSFFALSVVAVAACGALPGREDPADPSDATVSEPIRQSDASTRDATTSDANTPDAGTSDASAAEGPGGSRDASAPGACPTHEIAFTQETGCQNDGSVEFCVPKDDAALKARLLEIDAAIKFVGSGGRARCDTSRQLLAMMPLGDGDCVDGDAMTDSAWNKVCLIATERAVSAVVATWFE
jgi:hypothetical protein